VVSGKKGGKRPLARPLVELVGYTSPSKLNGQNSTRPFIHGEPRPLSLWIPTFAMAAPLPSPGIPGSTPTCIACRTLVVNSLAVCLSLGSIAGAVHLLHSVPCVASKTRPLCAPSEQPSQILQFHCHLQINVTMIMHQSYNLQLNTC